LVPRHPEGVHGRRSQRRHHRQRRRPGLPLLDRGRGRRRRRQRRRRSRPRPAIRRPGRRIGEGGDALMPVTEAYMAPGDFRVRLRVQTPHLMETVLEMGHIVILPQYPGNPAGFTEAELLDVARYTGVVLETEWANGVLTVYGTGLDWHLGEGNIGPRLQFYFSFDDTDLKETLTLMLDEC